MKLFSTSFFAIIAAISDSASASLAGSGRSSGRSRRIDFGTACEISVSTEVTPRVASIERCSRGLRPMWRVEKGALIFVS
jgi:hypothetical protein